MQQTKVVLKTWKRKTEYEKWLTHQMKKHMHVWPEKGKLTLITKCNIRMT
jgi:hypothetical protein